MHPYVLLDLDNGLGYYIAYLYIYVLLFVIIFKYSDVKECNQIICNLRRAVFIMEYC